MILFVSDMHFGRGSLEEEHAEERSLIHCLRHFESEVEHLFLVGDVYDQYIEYNNLIPKGTARFQGLLAEWTDAGKKVTYLTGNHDPWHINYFAEELGVRTISGTITEPLYGKHVYLNHGDIIASRLPLHAFIKRALQHPFPVYLYRTFLPGDAGFALANWVKKRIHSDVIDQEVVTMLQDHAQGLLEQTSNNTTSPNLVVMGHSHHPELTPKGTGAYLNTGCWRLQRTFACMDDEKVVLYRWPDTINSNKPDPEPLAAFSFATKTVTKTVV